MMGVAGFQKGNQRLYYMYSPTGKGEIYITITAPRDGVNFPYDPKKIYGIEQMEKILETNGWKSTDFAWFTNNKNVNLIIEKNPNGPGIEAAIKDGEFIKLPN